MAAWTFGFAVLSAANQALFAEKPSLPSLDFSIVPGKGMGTIEIGEKKPDDYAQYGRFIEVTRWDGNEVAEIKTESGDFFLVESQLRAGINSSKDVYRYYGKGTLRTDFSKKEKKYILDFPHKGLSFTIDARTEAIKSISVFMPIRPKY